MRNEIQVASGATSEAAFMEMALALARRGEGHTRPNPPVGAVIVSGGRVVGEGWHRRAGGDHAEVAALKDASRHSRSVRGATMFVTLEPCSRPGRVGACTDAIAASGVGRVVYACPDPNPTNRGRARRVLARHGIACERLDAKLPVARECAELIRPFAKHVTTGMPYVTGKIAMSLDGRICDDRGRARWISSEGSRRFTGCLRERVDAIMVGAETVRRDDPSLLSHGRRNDDLVRVVVSRSGRLPKRAQVFSDGKNETLVFRDGRDALAELGRRGVMHVLCEGGLKLAASLAEAGLVDEWLSVVAPIVIGGRCIGKAVRGKIAEDGVFAAFGDGFVRARFG